MANPPETPKSKDWNDGTTGKKRKTQAEERDTSGVGKDNKVEEEVKEAQEKDKEDKKEVEVYAGYEEEVEKIQEGKGKSKKQQPCFLEKDFILAEELEREIIEVFSHAYDASLLWTSYIRARGELMNLVKTRNPENMAVLRRDLDELTKKYSKRRKKRPNIDSISKKDWISVLKRLAMVRVYKCDVPSPPCGYGSGSGQFSNPIVERATDIYTSIHVQNDSSDFFRNICHQIKDELNSSVSKLDEQLPPEDMVGYNAWFILQPEYKDWNEEDLEHEGQEDQKLDVEDLEQEEDGDQKPSAVDLPQKHKVKMEEE